MTDLGHLRIGTADRRDAVARIERAAAEGRLTQAEASDRLARVEPALTYADLDPLIADLPSIAPPVVPLGWGAANRLPIAGGMSREKREGRWEIPPYLRVSGDLGSVRLDCREAVCLSPVVDIEVSAGAGGIKIIVPDGWGVDSDLVGKGWGSVRNSAERLAEPGQPQLVLHGSAGWAASGYGPRRGGAVASGGDGCAPSSPPAPPWCRVGSRSTPKCPTPTTCADPRRPVRGPQKRWSCPIWGPRRWWGSLKRCPAPIAQSAERLHGKEKVCGSIPHGGSVFGLTELPPVAQIPGVRTGAG